MSQVKGGASGKVHQMARKQTRQQMLSGGRRGNEFYAVESMPVNRAEAKERQRATSAIQRAHNDYQRPDRLTRAQAHERNVKERARKKALRNG